MLTATAQITGDFHRARRASLDMARSGTVRAVRVALDEGADYARRNHIHVRRSGAATSSANIRGVLTKQTRNGAEGVLENRAPHAAFLEYGTRPHLILPRDYFGAQASMAGGPVSRVTGKRAKGVTAGAGRGSALRFRLGGKIVFARSVRHPGTRPLPFMQPAAEFAGQVIVRETEHVTAVLIAALWE